MTSFDFTGLFKENELNIDSIYDNNNSNSPIITNNKIIITNSNQLNILEHSNQLYESYDDEIIYILKQIEMLGYNYNKESLSDEFIKIIGSILREVILFLYFSLFFSCYILIIEYL